MPVRRRRLIHRRRGLRIGHPSRIARPSFASEQTSDHIRENAVLTQSLTPSQLPERVFKKQGSFRGAPRYVEIGVPEPHQLPCDVYIKDGDTYVAVKVINEPDWADQSDLPPIDDAVQTKRERLLAMQSAAFHYLDTAAVREAYRQEEAAAATTARAGKGVPMDGPWLNEHGAATPPPMTEPGTDGGPGGAEQNDADALSPERMFLAYQRRLLANEGVTLDLEFEHRKPPALSQFDRVVRWLRAKHPTALAPDAALRKTRQRIAREATDKQMDELRAGGRAIIHAAFAVEHPTPEVVRLALSCPATAAFPESLRIEINLRADRIAESWRDQYSMEPAMTAYVMGTPLNWQKRQIDEGGAPQEQWLLSLKPFAIYS